MISLETLPEASAQEVFDRVAEHLLRQGVRCINNQGLCVYRDEIGNKCAAGALISDEEYSADIEVGLWGSLADEGIAPEDHLDLIQSLQEIHDGEQEDDWQVALDNLALDRGLLLYPREGS